MDSILNCFRLYTNKFDPQPISIFICPRRSRDLKKCPSLADSSTLALGPFPVDGEFRFSKCQPFPVIESPTRQKLTKLNKQHLELSDRPSVGFHPPRLFVISIINASWCWDRHVARSGPIIRPTLLQTGRPATTRQCHYGYGYYYYYYYARWLPALRLCDCIYF